MKVKISTTMVAKNRQNRAYRRFWLTEQNSQPPFFTTHPESNLTFDREKCDSRAGLTTPDSRIRLSQERLEARKWPDLDYFEGLGNGFEGLDSDFEGWNPRIGPFWGKGSLYFLPLARN